MRSAILAAFVVVGAAPLAADQTAVNPSANVQFGALRTADQANAYRRLFEVRESLSKAIAAQQPAATPAPKTKIVCGMTVVEVGPALDPKMGVPPPKDDKVTYTIRAVDPPICNPAR